MIKKNYKQPLLKIVYLGDNDIVAGSEDICTDTEDKPAFCDHIWGDRPTDF